MKNKSRTVNKENGIKENVVVRIIVPIFNAVNVIEKNNSECIEPRL